MHRDSLKCCHPGQSPTNFGCVVIPVNWLACVPWYLSRQCSSSEEQTIIYCPRMAHWTSITTWHACLALIPLNKGRKLNQLFVWRGGVLGNCLPGHLTELQSCVKQSEPEGMLYLIDSKQDVTASFQIIFALLLLEIMGGCIMRKAWTAHPFCINKYSGIKCLWFLLGWREKGRRQGENWNLILVTFSASNYILKQELLDNSS